MSRRVAEMIRAIEAQRDGFRLETSHLRDEERKTRAALDKVGADHEAAWENLVDQLVPSLAADVLERASHLLRLPEIGPKPTHARMQAEHAKLQATIARIDGDVRWQERAARDNEAQIRLVDAREALEPLEQSVRELEEEPVFLECINSGYGSEAYLGRFWQLSYYRHWKHGDLIVEKFGPRFGVTDFAGIRRRYTDEKAAILPLAADRDRWRGVLAELKQLDEERRKAADDVDSLAARQLAWVRGRLRNHLASLQPDERARMTGNDESLRIAYARVAGTEAKRDYLEQMQRELIAPAIADLSSAADKASRDLMKLRRPKNSGRTFSDADYTRRFGKDRTPSWQKRRARIQDARTRVVEFHHYDRWSYTNDLLWWDVMTDGELDGNFIREVRDRGPVDSSWRRDHASVASVSTRHDDLVHDIS